MTEKENPVLPIVGETEEVSGSFFPRDFHEEFDNDGAEDDRSDREKK